MKTRPMIVRKSIYALAFTAMALSACGGGSGGSSSQPTSPVPAPPPPHPAATNPILDLTVSKTEVFEDGLFLFDMSDTVSFPGAAIDFTITQLSGAPATLRERLNTYVFLYEAPDYDIDTFEDLSFRIDANQDGGGIDSEVVTIRVTGSSGVGRVVSRDSSITKIVRGHATSYRFNDATPPFTIVNRRDDLSQKSAFIGTRSGDVEDFSKDAIHTFSGDVDLFEKVMFSRLSFDLRPVEAASNFVALTDQEELVWYTSSPDGPGSPAEIFTASKRLGVANACEISGRTNTSQDYIFIGKSTGGFSQYKVEALRNSQGQSYDFDLTLLDTWGEDRSQCFLYPTYIPTRLQVDYETEGPSIVSIDFETLELVIYRNKGDAKAGEPINYEEIEVIPFDVGDKTDLQIVDIRDYGRPSGYPKEIVVLLSDRKINGTHYLVSLIQDVHSEWHQQSLTWSEGLPVSLLRGTFGLNGEYNPQYGDVVVVSQTPGTSMYFDNVGYDFNNTIAPSNYLPPVAFDTGPNVTSAGQIPARDIPSPADAPAQDIMVHREGGEIRIIKMLEQFPLGE